MKPDEPLKEAILALEQQFLSPQIRRSAALLEGLLTDDFTEIGKSGQKYRRSDIIECLANEKAPPQVAISDFEIAKLAENLVLATYKTVNKDTGASAYRCSIWQRREPSSGWRMRYHQGTPALSPV